MHPCTLTPFLAPLHACTPPFCWCIKRRGRRCCVALRRPRSTRCVHKPATPFTDHHQLTRTNPYFIKVCTTVEAKTLIELLPCTLGPNGSFGPSAKGCAVYLHGSWWCCRAAAPINPKHGNEFGPPGTGGGEPLGVPACAMTSRQQKERESTTAKNTLGTRGGGGGGQHCHWPARQATACSRLAREPRLSAEMATEGTRGQRVMAGAPGRRLPEATPGRRCCRRRAAPPRAGLSHLFRPRRCTEHRCRRFRCRYRWRCCWHHSCRRRRRCRCGGVQASAWWQAEGFAAPDAQSPRNNSPE